MSAEYPEQSFPPAGSGSDREQRGEAPGDSATSEDTVCHQATVLVRGETIRDPDTHASPKAAPSTDRERSSGREVSAAKVDKQNRLPALDDDADVGVQREQLVVRDGKSDLAFTGTLLASAASPTAPRGHWEEYRIYETNGGKHVFSKVTRSVFLEEQDGHKAEVFEPAPSSVPSQLLRSARELTRSRPLSWTDAAASFFGFNPLAKALYRKLGNRFDEHVS